ncbi:MAG: hypothetical protein EBX50_19690 [Chitinophagia bacterium]|nr:hypothetical protein [Chitinophagia bacterium]
MYIAFVIVWAIGRLLNPNRTHKAIRNQLWAILAPNWGWRRDWLIVEKRLVFEASMAEKTNNTDGHKVRSCTACGYGVG